MIHSLIIGFGISGLTYAEQLIKNKKKFIIIDEKEPGASSVASGVYNPTVLKRYSMTWNGDQFLKYAIPFYEKISKRIDQKINYPSSINRIFSKPAEFNQWSSASDNPVLKKYLLNQYFTEANKYINSPNGYGKVVNTGRIDLQQLIKTFKDQLENSIFNIDEFDYERLNIETGKIEYKGIMAKNIVFCEGHKIKYNPYFNFLPIRGSKGEMLIIKAPLLQENEIIKGPIFIVPIKNDLYWVGANFDNTYVTLNPTEKSKNWILEKLNKIIICSYKVIEHKAHIRPTVADRKPIIGTHKEFKNLHVLNGLGSRGILSAPLLSNWLYQSIQSNEKIPIEVNISRFN